MTKKIVLGMLVLGLTINLAGGATATGSTDSTDSTSSPQASSPQAGSPQAAPTEAAPALRGRAEKAHKDGNYKDAFALYQQLALDPQPDAFNKWKDFQMASVSLQNLGRWDELDAFLESVVSLHKDDVRLRMTAAQQLQGWNHNGFIVSGEFKRGGHRGGGRHVSSFDRDRVRALQLMAGALSAAAKSADKVLLAEFYTRFAGMLLDNRDGGGAWRLQVLTDLAVLPDYEERYYQENYSGRGAPVNADGSPVYYTVPAAFDAARNDGERWRWMLARQAELGPDNATDAKMGLANFLHTQFGVQTLADFGRFIPLPEEDNKKNESGVYAVHTLKENETIAKLASGIKRFTLPDEFNYIRLFKEIADAGKSDDGHDALVSLAGVFEDRRQYDKAIEYWKRIIKDYPLHEKGARERLDQITGNWGQFESLASLPAGQEPTLQFRFRNGKKVSFEAHEIKVKAILDDAMAYLQSDPKELQWDKINIADVGYRLVTKEETKYIAGKAAAWSMDLDPRPAHFDRRVSVTAPLKKPGAYLVTARMEDGNISKIVVWLNDTAIVRKPLDKEVLYFVADAVNGRPVSGADVTFFGYRQEWVERAMMKNRVMEVRTQNVQRKTDENGLVILAENELSNRYTWLAIAATEDGRQAYMGFSGVWYPHRYDAEYNNVRVLTMTDRPVYRPSQTVKFKCWVRRSQYDMAESSEFAGQLFPLEIRNPKGDKVFEGQFQADAYAGLSGEFVLPKDATLGQYRLIIPNRGGGSFRVEEYKKPEFEVKVEAPTEPVMLGEKVTATIKAAYYFGAPVAKGRVKYKVVRTEFGANWYPMGVWDWFYGKGYWWYAYDYLWYPGWTSWGCSRPCFAWWPRPTPPPETVAEREVDIPPDGILKVEIDTAPAKEIFGDRDHQYEITAEVTDESRRTIVGAGRVLMARKPFQVYV
ncbi:MAG: alpha-2-macroglobulin, partial [Lentisphaerae bacterium]|nr:alpha-2-macroglobulin [Lentisphaerota bacterium]